MVTESTSVKAGRGPGAIETFSCVVKNIDNSRSIDITELVIDASIYEDIFAGTVYGIVAIRDAVNLMNGMSQPAGNAQVFPIVGEEFIEFTYGLQGTPEVFRRFAIYAIKEVTISDSMNLREYVIQFASEEHMLDAISTVQKSYKDLISNMVKDILTDYLKVDQDQVNGKRKKSYDIQPTRGQQHIVIPRLSPLKALEFLSKRSIAQEKYNSASYLFFENKDGFNFCDVEYLIEKGKRKINANIDRYRYFYSSAKISTGDTADVNKNDFKNILSMRQKHRFDTMEKLKRGYFESSVMTYEFLDKNVRKNTYKFLDKYKDQNSLGAETGESYPENSLDFMNSVTSEKDKKFLGLFSLNKDKVQGKNSRAFWIPKDTSKPDTFLDEIYPNRASFMTRLAQNMFTVDVYGDTEITAGDIILLDMPEIIGTTGNSKSQFDAYISGYFLVSSIHHKLSPDSYMCTYDIFKNGYSQPVITNNNADVSEPSLTKW